MRNIQLVSLKTYVKRGVVYHAGKTYSLDDSLAKELLAIKLNGVSLFVVATNKKVATNKVDKKDGSGTVSKKAEVDI